MIKFRWVEHRTVVVKNGLSYSLYIIRMYCINLYYQEICTVETFNKDYLLVIFFTFPPSSEKIMDSSSFIREENWSYSS